jgi:hypothetical protein
LIKPKGDTSNNPKTNQATRQAILDDDRFDEDRHNAIRRALKTKAPELADLVDRAERGDIILDLVGEEERYKKANKKAAALFFELFHSEGAPDFLTGEMLAVAERAAKIKGVQIYKKAENMEGDDFDTAGLAELFAITRLFSFDRDEPDEELSETDAARQRVTEALNEAA